MDEGLPIPSYLQHLARGVTIAYAIDGYFATKKGSEYLNDIIARFLITFRAYNPERIKEKPRFKPLGHYYPKVYKLKELQALKSISKQKCPQARADKFDDFTFWAIKFFCEDCIKEQGMATFEQLLEFALANFEHKETSTLKAKCRSIWNWYEKRGWTIPKRSKQTKEEYMATRQEHMRNLRKKEEQTNYNKVVNCITGLYAPTYKKKSGAWHIAKIAKDIGLSRNTVSKHLRAYLQKHSL